MPKTLDAPQPEPPIVVVDPPSGDEPTPVADAIDKTGGENFVLDQMADTLERARITAQGRTDDLSIRWGAEQVQVAAEDDGPDVWASRYFVQRDGAETLHGLTVDEAKVALDAIGAE